MRALLMALCFAATTSVPTAQAESIQSAKADIEKWIDADGQVHYGDMPPPEAEASPLQVRPNVIEVEQAAVPAAPPTPRGADLPTSLLSNRVVTPEASSTSRQRERSTGPVAQHSRVSHPRNRLLRSAPRAPAGSARTLPWAP